MTIRQRLALLTVLALAIGLFVGGAQPIAVGLLSEPWDKVAHSTVFAAIAFLLAYSRVRQHWGWLIASALLSAAVGAVDEIHQYFLPGRSCDWADLAADALGSTAGVTLYFLLVRSARLG
jgi:VanZ family protein